MSNAVEAKIDLEGIIASLYRYGINQSVINNKLKNNPFLLTLILQKLAATPLADFFMCNAASRYPFSSRLTSVGGA